MNLRDTYNKIAEDWFKDHGDDTWHIEGINKFISFLNKGALVLDLGCGAGIKSKFLSERGLKVVGIDFSEKMIEIAKREFPLATFYVMDIKDLANLKETFDGIFAQAILLHVPKSEVGAMIAKLIERLKTGGYLYIAVKEIRTGEKDEQIVIEEDYGYKYERFFSYFTLPEIKNHLLKLGMKICWENIVSSGKTNWIQIIGQK